jgi:hypothetical protein
MRLRMLLVPIVASVALLAGCSLVNPGATPTPVSNGVQDEEADQILAKATDALGAASSVHAAGTLGEGMLGLTLDLTYAGDDVTGTVNIFGVLATIIKVDDEFYVKADTSLFEGLLGQDQQGSLTLFNGKWIKISLSLVETFMPVPLSVTDLVDVTPPLTKGELTTVGDTSAITVTDADGAVLHVATVGEPYLLDISAERDRNLKFSKFGDEVLIEAPSEDEVFDLFAELGLG